MNSARRNIALILLGTVFAGVTLYLTLYCAALNKRIVAVSKQYENLLVHSMEISKNIETVRESLDQLEQTSLKFSNLEDKKYRSQLTQGTADADDEPVPQNMFFLEKNYENLHHIINHLQRSTYAIKLSSSRANSIPSILPTLGRINSQYGVRISPLTQKPRIHKGIDVAANMGTPVYATANGIVDFLGWNGRYGKSVTIKHGFGFKTRYAHVQSFFVKKGNYVKRGQVIAAVGRTGSTTGAHLHYEVLLNNNHINPLPFIAQEQLKMFAGTGSEDNTTNIVFLHQPKTRSLLQPHTGTPAPLGLKIGFFSALLFVMVFVLGAFHFKLNFISGIYQRFHQRHRRNSPAESSRRDPVKYWPESQSNPAKETQIAKPCRQFQ